MKKISKIVFSDKELLNDNEMKRVLGGESTSSWCYTGEFLYFCRASITGSYDDVKDMGSVCATSSLNARDKLIKALRDQGVIETIMVTCG